MNIIHGNLLTLAKQGQFDVIVHGCNCFCTMGSGIANNIRIMWPGAYATDKETPLGDYNKLGTFSKYTTVEQNRTLTIINAYTQYNTSSQPRCLFEYTAFELILQKLTHLFPTSHIAFPMIGAGLAGGDPERIVTMIENFDEQLSSTEGTTTLVILPTTTQIAA